MDQSTRPQRPPCIVPGCGLPQRKREWCAKHYTRQRYAGLPNLPVPTREELFWRHVDKNGPVPEHCPELGPCWVWTASISNGYGQFSNRPHSPITAHRQAWIFTNGPVPEKMDVCHKCDNRPCCRPTHLFVGTRAENLADMCAKGRQIQGDRTNACKHPEWFRGERNGMAKLAEEQVDDIHELYAKGGVSQAELGRRFGVSQTQIGRIVRGERWRHVESTH